MSFSKVAILGPGLLGGSLALALRAQAKDIALYCRRAAAAEELKSTGIAPVVTTDPAEAVRGADVVVLCVPIGAMEGLSRQIQGAVDPSALITDVGSVKAPVVAALEPIFFGRGCWVGSHPMAGSEKAGFSAARADLFEGATTIVTPTARTKGGAAGRARAFWESVGSRVLEFPPERHDELVAQISHLPHLLAAVLVASASEAGLGMIGNGFRDTTRVASGPADLWTEILLSNRRAVAQALEELTKVLARARGQLKEGDEKGLHELLARANHIRSQLPPKSR